MTLFACSFAIVSLLGLPAELRRTLTLSDVTQVGFHPSLFPDTGTAFDFSTIASAVLAFRIKRSEFDLTYTPRFTYVDMFGSNAQGLQLQEGIASYSYSQRKYRFTIAQSGSIGTQNFSTLTTTAAPSANPGAPADPTAPQVNPILRTSVRVASEQTSASFSYNWTKRWVSTVYGAYGISGGRGVEDQIALPQTTTTTAGGLLNYVMSKRDQFATSVAYVENDVSNGFDHHELLVSELWSHSFSRRLSGSLSLGFVHDQSTITANGTVTDTTETTPTGSIGLTGSLVRRKRFDVSVTAGATFGFVLNPVTGELQKRLTWLSMLNVRREKTTLTVTLDGAQTFPHDDPAAYDIVGLGFVLTQDLSKIVSVSAGYRRIWQTTTVTTIDGTTTELTQPELWYAFAGVSIHPPPIRL